MGRRKNSSSKSTSELDNRCTHPTQDNTETGDLSVLTQDQAQYFRDAGVSVFREIFCDNSFGFTIIHQVCKEGKAQLLHDLLQIWADLDPDYSLEKPDLESKYTALHDAIYYGNINCSVKLIQHGALLNSPDIDGYSPLNLAVWGQSKNGFVAESKNLNVLTWGPNSNYNLGHNHDRNLKMPEKVKLFNRDKFTSSICNVRFGKYHTLFLDRSGCVWSCGHGKGGRLGLGSEQTHLQPVRIPELHDVVKISCSNDHSLALTRDGRVYSWGLNIHKVLGHTDNKHFAIARPQVVKIVSAFSKIVTVKAAKYHSVLVAADQIYTFGFNGGQLGHAAHTDPEEKYEIVPRCVTRLRHKPGDNRGKIAHVHASAAATVVGFEYGAVFICSEYDIRRVAHLNRYDTNVVNLSASRVYSFNVRTKKIRVTGGKLSRQVDDSAGKGKETKPLLIALLDTNGMLFCCVPALFKNVLIYHWDVFSDRFLVTDISLGSYSLTLLTTTGQVYTCDPYPTVRTQKDSRKDMSTQKAWTAVNSRRKDAVQRLRPVKLAIQAGLHNGIKVVCNATGLVKGCIVQDRVSTLDFLPSKEESSFCGDIGALFDNDDVFDTDFTVYCDSGRQFSVHKSVLANASVKLQNVVKSAEENDRTYIDIPGSDQTVRAMLETVYKINPINQKTKLTSLYNGWVNVSRGFHRDTISDFTDAVLISEDGAKFSCHKCILAARVEYFRTHFMINSRWGCSNLNQEIPIDTNKRTLADFIYFIYTDEFPKNNDFESLKLLLALSDQYLVSRLKSFCEVSLAQFLTEENLLHVLRSANDYNARNLRTCCLHVLAMNMPYYLEHRLLECLEEELLDQLDTVYKEVVLFHMNLKVSTDYSVERFLNWISPNGSVPDEEKPEKVKIKGLPDELEEYISGEEEEEEEEEEKIEVTSEPIAATSPEVHEEGEPEESSLNGAAAVSTPDTNINKKMVDREDFTGKRKGKKKRKGDTNVAHVPKDSHPTSPTPSVDPPLSPPIQTPSPTKSLKPGWGSTPGQSTSLSLTQIIEEEERLRNMSLKHKEPAKRTSPNGTVPLIPGPVKPCSSRGAAWAASPSSACVSLKEIINSEPPTKPRPPPSPTQPPRNTTPSQTSPACATRQGKSETFDFSADRRVVSLARIMEAEEATVSRTLPTNYSRPLEVIQTEERAIQELRELYKVDEVVNEFITIRTVGSIGNESRPVWGRNNPDLHF